MTHLLEYGTLKLMPDTQMVKLKLKQKLLSARTARICCICLGSLLTVTVSVVDVVCGNQQSNENKAKNENSKILLRCFGKGNITKWHPSDDDCRKPSDWDEDYYKGYNGCYPLVPPCKSFPGPPKNVTASFSFNPESKGLDMLIQWCPPEKQKTWGFLINLKIYGKSALEAYTYKCARTLENQLFHTFKAIRLFDRSFHVTVRSIPDDDIHKAKTRLFAKDECFYYQKGGYLPPTSCALSSTTTTAPTSTGLPTSTGHPTSTGNPTSTGHLTSPGHPMIKTLTITAWASGAVAITIILGILMLAIKKKWKALAGDNGSAGGLIQQPSPNISSDEEDVSSVPEDNCKHGPIVFLLCCRGCEVVEGFTVYLTHILRKNGVNASSDLFEQTEIRKQGLATYLESNLNDADYVILVCTQAIHGQHKPDHQPFFSVMNIINHKIVSEGMPRTKYIPIYFENRDEVIPIFLHPEAIDFNTILMTERIKMILHRILHISDIHKICINNSLTKLFQELRRYTTRVLFDAHHECSRYSCFKGRKTVSEDTFLTGSKGSNLTCSTAKMSQQLSVDVSSSFSFSSSSSGNVNNNGPKVAQSIQLLSSSTNIKMKKKACVLLV